MSRPRRLAVAVAVVMLVAGVASRTAGAATLTPVGDFVSPTYVTSSPHDAHRLFVVERRGVVRLVKDGVVQPAPYLDVSSSTTTGNETGMFSMALAPDYETSGLGYVVFSGVGTNEIHVEEFRRSAADPNVADPLSRRTVLTIPHAAALHFGGQLQFGPEGLLYISTGDGGEGPHDPSNNAQNLGSLLGKILRIDPRGSNGQPYTVPAGNPFVGQPGARGEVYAYGFRNPWRFSFDRVTGDLTVGDVGELQREELDFLPAADAAGKNFGWDAWEGTLRADLTTPEPPAFITVFPVFEWQHGAACTDVVGGYVVRDPQLPELAGRYLYGDTCIGAIRSLVPGRPAAADDQAFGETLSLIVSFGEDALGRVYAVSLNGRVARFSPGSPAPTSPVSPPVDVAAPLAATTPAAVPRDTVAPSLTLRQRTRERHFLRNRRLVIRARCTEACRLRASGYVRIAPSSHRWSLTGSSALVARGTEALTLRAAPSIVRRVRRALQGNRAVTVFERVVAADRAGNQRIAHQRVRIVG
jgi:glucose/arabinose dehydrogenase